MEGIRDAIERRHRVLVTVSIYAVVVGAISIAVNLSDAASGSVPELARALLGVLGIIAGILAWTMRTEMPTGWHLLMAWAVIQIPIFAWDPAGSPTTQIVAFPISVTSQTEVGGEITSYTEFGVNVVGVILAAVVSQRRRLFFQERVEAPV